MNRLVHIFSIPLNFIALNQISLKFYSCIGKPSSVFNCASIISTGKLAATANNIFRPLLGCKPQSTRTNRKLQQMDVLILSALEDNYMYLLIDPTTKVAAAIDPVEPDKIMEAVKTGNLNLTTVLTTHHHLDHSGGNQKIAEMKPDLTIYGGDDRIAAMTQKVIHNQKFKLGNLTVTSLETPCHTSGHICYFVESPTEDRPIVFTGDTLFLAGCGRFFEGTAPQMFHALIEVLAVLPPHTLVYCGHEYALSNLSFALHSQPNNEAVKKKIEDIKGKLSQKLPSVPSTMNEELSYNPFMRVNQEEIYKFTGKTTPFEAMGTLRAIKDEFKPSPL